MNHDEFIFDKLFELKFWENWTQTCWSWKAREYFRKMFVLWTQVNVQVSRVHRFDGRLLLIPLFT